MNQVDIHYWIATGYLRGIGAIRLREALMFFGDIKAFFTASSRSLQEAGLSAKQIASLQQINWRQIALDVAWCEKHHCQLIHWDDPRYPALLREIPDKPPLLYVKGDVSLLNQPQLAMVGSRHPTSVGAETAQHFAFALAQAGLIVTSGLALGIDAASHQGALAASGKTIAVMGTGLKHIYPKSHARLANTILDHGAIMSEFSLDTPPKALYFPLRNRLISGLSLGVLVVEAALKSGSLITARFAAEQGRDVFAIPSSIHHPLGKGCHYLIRQGAKLVENVEDILEELSAFNFKKTAYPTVVLPKAEEEMDAISQQLLAKIGFEPVTMDTLAVRCGVACSEIASALLLLELKGYIGSVPGGYIRQR